MNSSFQGSVAEGVASPVPLELSLSGAIARGLKYNLAVLNSSLSAENARAQRMVALSSLLPGVNANYSQSYQRVNLAALGFHFSAPPGTPFQIPSIVTFGNVDTRVTVNQTFFDLQKLRNFQSANASIRAAQLSLQDSRDLVVQAVGNAYLLLISDTARVEAIQAQVDTSKVLFQRAADQRTAGTVPAIDQLRSEVQLRTDEQSLLVARNQFEKDKLVLARVIGLPPGQQFNLTDRLPFTPLDQMTPEAALQQAVANRSDLKAAQEMVRAAELSRKAAFAQYYPTAGVNGNFGDAGSSLNSSHNVFDVTGSVNFSIFNGGRIKAQVEEADVALKQQRDALADLRGRIDQEIRSALLDLQSAADQVAVAQRNVELATETLTQSRDRFAAGVSDNVEVVQAQQQRVTADTNLINANYQHNLAKIELARSLGLTEQNLTRFLGGK